MTTTTHTTDRAAVAAALFMTTLGERFAALPVVERAALRAALDAARNENPLDPALVEIAIILSIAVERVRIDA